MNKKGEAEGAVDLWIYIISILMFTVILGFLFFTVKAGGIDTTTVNITDKGENNILAKKILLNFLKTEDVVLGERLTMYDIVTLVDHPINKEFREESFNKNANNILNVSIPKPSSNYNIEPNAYIIVAEPNERYYTNTNGKYHKFYIDKNPIRGYAGSIGSPGLCGEEEVIVRQRIKKINGGEVDVVLCVQKSVLI